MAIKPQRASWCELGFAVPCEGEDMIHILRFPMEGYNYDPTPPRPKAKACCHVVYRPQHNDWSQEKLSDCTPATLRELFDKPKEIARKAIAMSANRFAQTEEARERVRELIKQRNAITQELVEAKYGK